MPDDQLFNSAIDDPKTWKRSGNKLFKRGFYKLALKFYTRAIELNPGFIEAWNNLGLSFLKIGKIEEAKRCNEKVRELKQRSGISQRITSSTVVNKRHRGRSAKSQILINDNFWYAFCIAILVGISLAILTINPPFKDLIQTLGFILGLSVLCFAFVYLLLQYVLRTPKR